MDISLHDVEEQVKGGLSALHKHAVENPNSTAFTPLMKACAIGDNKTSEFYMMMPNLFASPESLVDHLTDSAKMIAALDVFPVMIVFLAEAWDSDNPTMRASEDPNRREVILISGMSYCRTHQCSIKVPILRDENNHMRFDFAGTKPHHTPSVLLEKMYILLEKLGKCKPPYGRGFLPPGDQEYAE